MASELSFAGEYEWHRKPVAGPDFICVGMAKAGTRWLYDQLRNHPDFWMPPVKEVNYLLNYPPAMKNSTRKRDRSRKGGKFALGLTQRDRDFLEEASIGPTDLENLEHYISLFRHKCGLLSGDISPRYALLGEPEIARVARCLPHTKVLILIRDPLARFWSGLSMTYRTGRFDVAMLEDEVRFRLFLAEKSDEKRMLPTVIVEQWRRLLPEKRFGFFFLDDIAQQPIQARQKILQFLGADPKKAGGTVPAGYNRKSTAPKLPMSETTKSILVEYFGDEILACAKYFGGPAQFWPAQYGL